MADDTEMSPDATMAGPAYTLYGADVWDMARRAYVEGDPATVVCERYGLSRSTFHARAAREGWRRKDQPVIERTPYLTIQGADVDPSRFDFVEMARLRMIHAIGHGSAAEAAGWFRFMLAMDREGHLIDPHLTE